MNELFYTVNIVIYLSLLIFSVVIHECAHGWMALKYGDDTAFRLGRLTLNPIPHIDLFGSIIVPMLLILSHSGFFIAWAKPVPVNVLRVKNPRTGLPLISAAGPASNLIQMLIGCILLFFLQKMLFFQAYPLILTFLFAYIKINLALALFNLLPVAPLDGSTVISFFMPDEIADRYEAKLRQFGAFPLLIILLIDAILGFWFQIWEPVFGWIFHLLSLPYPF
jgi:Zn-dependent protease